MHSYLLTLRTIIFRQFDVQKREREMKCTRLNHGGDDNGGGRSWSAETCGAADCGPRGGGAGQLLMRCLVATAVLSALAQPSVCFALRPPWRSLHTVSDNISSGGGGGGGSDKATNEPAQDLNPDHQEALSSRRKRPSRSDNGLRVGLDTADTIHHHHHWSLHHRYYDAHGSDSKNHTRVYRHRLHSELATARSRGEAGDTLSLVAKTRPTNVRRYSSSDSNAPPPLHALASPDVPSLPSQQLTVPSASNVDQEANSEKTNSDSRPPLLPPHSHYPQQHLQPSRWLGLKKIPRTPSSEKSKAARVKDSFASKHRQAAQVGAFTVERRRSEFHGKQVEAISRGTSTGNNAASTRGDSPNNFASASRNRDSDVTKKPSSEGRSHPSHGLLDADRRAGDDNFIEVVQVALGKSSVRVRQDGTGHDAGQLQSTHEPNHNRENRRTFILLNGTSSWRPASSAHPYENRDAVSLNSDLRFTTNDKNAVQLDNVYFASQGRDRSAAAESDPFTSVIDNTSGVQGNESPGDQGSFSRSVLVSNENQHGAAPAVPPRSQVGYPEPQTLAVKQSSPSVQRGSPHVFNMVLTVLGSFTAVAGVCVMAAIFQCCCRRRRGGSPSDDDEAAKKKKQQQQQQTQQQDTGLKGRSSKSPSPQKVINEVEADEEDKETKGPTELEDDEDLGDFSVVQRETEILRSYRKPPPPKNRARASRVPRALKSVSPNASPDIFQELIEKEEAERSFIRRDLTSSRPANGPTAPDVMMTSTTSTSTSSDFMHSSMLADIDKTLAFMHSDNHDEETVDNTEPPVKRSREESVEKPLVATIVAAVAESPAKPSSKDNNTSSSSIKDKVLATETSSLKHQDTGDGSRADTQKGESRRDDSILLTAATKEGSPEQPDTKEHNLRSKEAGGTKPSVKPSTKGEPTCFSPSREEIAKVLEQELLKSAGKEGLFKMQVGEKPPTVSPKPRREAAKASPAKDSKDNGAVQPVTRDGESSSNSGSGNSSGSARDSPEEGTRTQRNIFSLIDPTAKDKGEDPASKSKIPVRAASNPTQVTAPLRPAAGRDKRFPVPSVHGDQMDQLMKSLKSRLGEDSASPKRPTNKVSPEDGAAITDDNLQPQGRDRSHSDPNQKQEERKNKVSTQTHL